MVQASPRSHKPIPWPAEPARRMLSAMVVRPLSDEEAGALWWAGLLVGGLSIVAGIIALAKPGPTLNFIAIVFGVYLLVAAMLQLARAFSSRAGSRLRALLYAALAFVAGVIVVSHPDGSVRVVALTVGIYLLAVGCYRTVVALQVSEERGWLLVAALLDVAIGILIVAWPKFGVASLAIVLGISLIVRGLLACAVAIVAHHEHGTPPQPRPAQ